VQELGEDHDPRDKKAALEKAQMTEETMPIGILYRTEPRTAFAHRYRAEVTDGPLAEMPAMEADHLEEVVSRYRPLFTR